jgi:hypothetical protein
VVVAILSLSAYTFAHWLTVENELSALEVRRIKARCHSESAAAMVAALVSAQQRGRRIPNLHDNAELFSGIACERSEPANAVDSTADDAAARGQAAVFVPILQSGGATSSRTSATRRPALNDSPSIRFGVEREAGRIHLMHWLRANPEALRTALLELPRSNEALVDAVLDWLDSDSITRSAGAELREYESGPAALRPRNGAIDSLDELLLVRGMTREIWFGTREIGEPGWRDFLTLASRERNVDRFGRPRLWLNDPNVARLAGDVEKEFGPPLAQFIKAFRAAPASGSQPARTFRSVWELVDATAVADDKTIESPLRSTDPG